MMTPKFRKLAAPAVLIGGISGVLSWVVDMPLLRGQLNPAESVSMKWNTSLCFALMGLSLLLLRWRAHPTGAIAAMSCAGWAVAIMSLLAVASLTGHVDGVVALGVTEGDTGYQSVGHGVPSWGTMAAFIAIGLWSVIFACDTEHARRWMPLAYLSGVMGFVATAAHGVGWAPGYFHWPRWSTGMAAMTASLFILLSVSARSLTREARP